MPNIGPGELIVMALPFLVLGWIVRSWVLGMRKRGQQLDRIERRLDDIDSRGADGTPRD